MTDATGEANKALRVAFDRRLKLEFHGARITSDGGLLAYRELDDALGLSVMGVSALAEGRPGKNIRHRLLGLLRQAVYGRLAGYEDVNDAERLARDPAMRAIVGREGLGRPAASSSEMGRFETGWLASEANLAALADPSGAWIERMHQQGRRMRSAAQTLFDLSVPMSLQDNHGVLQVWTCGRRQIGKSTKRPGGVTRATFPTKSGRSPPASSRTTGHRAPPFGRSSRPACT